MLSPLAALRDQGAWCFRRALHRLVQPAAFARECAEQLGILAAAETDRIDADTATHRLARIAHHRERGDPDKTEVELVHIGPEPSVYRRSLSIYNDGSGGLRLFGVLATSIGGASAVTGTALLPIGLAKDSSGLTISGGITLGVGAVLLAIGIWAIRADSPTYRPGASNHFPL